jgi:hypothetical protein
MLPNYLALPMLVLNVIAALILKPWYTLPLCVKHIRLMRMVNAYRYAGLFIVLAASFAHAQYEVFEDQARCPGCIGISGAVGTKHEIGKTSSVVARRYEEAKRHIMLDIPQHTNPNQWMWQAESCSPAAQRHMDCINTAMYLGNNKYTVTWYDAMMFTFKGNATIGYVGEDGVTGKDGVNGADGVKGKDGAMAIIPRVATLKDGDWLIAQQMYAEKGIQYDGVDWTNFMDFPNLTRYAMWIWLHSGRLLILAFLGFLLVQFSGGARESNDTDIEDMLDPDYKTGFVENYHGDDSFEVPNGMRSAHRSVPVRRR